MVVSITDIATFELGADRNNRYWLHLRDSFLRHGAEVSCNFTAEQLRDLVVEINETLESEPTAAAREGA